MTKEQIEANFDDLKATYVRLNDSRNTINHSINKLEEIECFLRQEREKINEIKTPQKIKES